MRLGASGDAGGDGFKGHQWSYRGRVKLGGDGFKGHQRNRGFIWGRVKSL